MVSHPWAQRVIIELSRTAKFQDTLMISSLHKASLKVSRSQVLQMAHVRFGPQFRGACQDIRDDDEFYALVSLQVHEPEQITCPTAKPGTQAGGVTANYLHPSASCSNRHTT